MAAEVKFTISVPALDALRRIVQRDFFNDTELHKRIQALPEGERSEGHRLLLRNEQDRMIVERSLGFDGSKNEKGQ